MAPIRYGVLPNFKGDSFFYPYNTSKVYPIVLRIKHLYVPQQFCKHYTGHSVCAPAAKGVTAYAQGRSQCLSGLGVVPKAGIACRDRDFRKHKRSQYRIHEAGDRRCYQVANRKIKWLMFVPVGSVLINSPKASKKGYAILSLQRSSHQSTQEETTEEDIDEKGWQCGKKRGSHKNIPLHELTSREVIERNSHRPV